MIQPPELVEELVEAWHTLGNLGVGHALTLECGTIGASDLKRVRFRVPGQSPAGAPNR